MTQSSAQRDTNMENRTFFKKKKDKRHREQNETSEKE